MSPLLLWILGCALVGYLGRFRAIGFIGFFILSFIFSPILMGILLLVTMPRRNPAQP